jgi:hypothetical protein
MGCGIRRRWQQQWQRQWRQMTTTARLMATARRATMKATA